MTHADPVETLRRLEEWEGESKYNKYTVESVFCGGFGRIVTVTLRNWLHKKEALAGDYELWDPGVPNQETTFNPNLLDVIKLALDRWDGLVPQYGEEDGTAAATG